jgi:Ran GTPase-activating protein (RanGAP) involved in mRNA processing and transport
MLSRCKLSESSAELLGSIISSGKSSLETLDLSYNHFNSYGLSKLIESLLSNKNSKGRIKSLNLAWNNFRQSLPLENLYKFVSKCITLLHLDLSCCL